MENIYTSAEHFLKFSTILGLFPCSFDGPAKDGKTKKSVFGAFCSVLSLSMSVFLMAVNLTSETRRDSQLLKIAWDISKVAGSFSFLSMFFYQMSKVESIKMFLKTIDELDGIVSELIQFSLS
jgi:hypothetical protein